VSFVSLVSKLFWLEYLPWHVSKTHGGLHGISQSGDRLQQGRQELRSVGHDHRAQEPAPRLRQRADVGDQKAPRGNHDGRSEHLGTAHQPGRRFRVPLRRLSTRQRRALARHGLGGLRDLHFRRDEDGTGSGLRGAQAGRRGDPARHQSQLGGSGQSALRDGLRADRDRRRQVDRLGGEEGDAARALKASTQRTQRTRRTQRKSIQESKNQKKGRIHLVGKVDPALFLVIRAAAQ